MTYVCGICKQTIEREAHGGEHPSAGDHDPSWHVAAAYGTIHPDLTLEDLLR